MSGLPLDTAAPRAAPSTFVTVLAWVFIVFAGMGIGGMLLEAAIMAFVVPKLSQVRGIPAQAAPHRWALRSLS